VETALDELRSHLRGARTVLGKQEFHGLTMAPFAIRGLMREAVLRDGLDPDDLSFIHTLSAARRRPPQLVALPALDAVRSSTRRLWVRSSHPVYVPAAGAAPLEASNAK
jgi:hypothetical protein